MKEGCIRSGSTSMLAAACGFPVSKAEKRGGIGVIGETGERQHPTHPERLSGTTAEELNLGVEFHAARPDGVAYRRIPAPDSAECEESSCGHDSVAGSKARCPYDSRLYQRQLLSVSLGSRLERTTLAYNCQSSSVAPSDYPDAYHSAGQRQNNMNSMNSVAQHFALRLSHGGTGLVIPSVVQLFAWLFQLAILWTIIVAVYRIWLHPLAKVPGPRLAAVSQLWKMRADWRYRRAHLMLAEHQKYGPVIRVAPNELSFANPAVLQTMYSHKGFAKSDVGLFWLHQEVSRSLTCV